MALAQLSLLGRDAPSLSSLGGLRRIALDGESWLDTLPGYLQGHAQLFDELWARVPFREERRVMYEREVDVPRLVASAEIDVHPVVAEIAHALNAHYAASIDHIGLALYRHGRDSVAWHRDKMVRDRPTLVAIVSLGTPRKLLVRPFGGGASRSFTLGFGDLFVMGGMCQATYEHHIPKVRSAAPRMSLMFRHVYDAPPGHPHG